MADIRYPPLEKNRGRLFWLRPANLWHSRESFLRVDKSTEKRDILRKNSKETSFSKNVNDVLQGGGSAAEQGYRFVILGDTGEGDKSQYSLVPLVRALKPNFMIINGDVAYPAGRLDENNPTESDFHCGFFEPYNNLGIPIWATAGNHEYYSPDEGQEFYDLFCSTKHETLWHQYGLPFSAKTKQPFLYWEMTDQKNKLSIIGLDTGKEANLDGHTSWWQVWLKKPEDSAQVAWLQERLQECEKFGRSAMILFHIPALVNSDVAEEYMKNLHRVLASFSCVQAVVAGHIHNMQMYSSGEWSRFIQNYSGTAPQSKTTNYVVSGSGGASLHATDFTQSPYPPQTLFPSRAQWKQHAKVFSKIRSFFGLERSLAGNMISDVGAMFNSDPGTYLSLLCVDVQADGTKVCTPYWIDNIKNLYPANAIVDIASNQPPLSDTAVQLCKQQQLQFTL